jgi:alginate O-acetyltransferase complex protein AlgI
VSLRSMHGGAWLVLAVAVHVTMVAAIVRSALLSGALQGIHGLLVPFGASYFACHGISYVVDVYRRRVPANRSRCQLAVHLVLLPVIVGGPVAYEGVAPYLAHGWPSLSDYSYGVRRLLIGVWKVFVMAAIAGRQADLTFALRPGQLSAVQAWLGLGCFALQMYYGFSGYADMGIGVGRMLGLRLPENFRWPYVGQSVGEFWRRWHLGLSGWFREYAVVPLEGASVAASSAIRETLVVLLCGIWYGARWTFVAWGLFHAVLLLIERAGLDVALKRLPTALRHVYVLAAVMAGWVVLRSETLGGALSFVKALVGVNASAPHSQPAVPIELWFVATAGAIGCAPVFQSVRRWTVAIDALILSLLMLLFAPVLFAWRCGSIAGTPVLRWWQRVAGR